MTLPIELWIVLVLVLIPIYVTIISAAAYMGKVVAIKILFKKRGDC